MCVRKQRMLRTETKIRVEGFYSPLPVLGRPLSGGAGVTEALGLPGQGAPQGRVQP